MAVQVLHPLAQAEVVVLSLMRQGTQPMRVPLPLVLDQEQQVLLAPKVTPVVPLAALVSLRECVV